jgi:hypothetical protein
MTRIQHRALVGLLILCTLLAQSAIRPTSANGLNDQGFEYTVAYGEATVTDCFPYNRCPAQLVIPESLGGFPVTKIGKSAFDRKQLTSVTIPDSVLEIGSHAFAGDVSLGTNRALASVSLGNSVVTIGDNAFQNTSISDLTIPDSVTRIGQYTFANSNVRTLHLGSAVAAIDTSAFERNWLTSLSLPDSVQYIGPRAFSSNLLQAISIGRSVRDIRNGAFQGNQLTTISFPASLVLLETNALANNKLTTITFYGNPPGGFAPRVNGNANLGRIYSYPSKRWGSTWEGVAVTQLREKPFLIFSSPRITGEPRVAYALTALNGDWSANPTAVFRYQWYRCSSMGFLSELVPDNCVAIAEADAQTYAPANSDYGQFVRVKVTASNVEGSTSYLTASYTRVAGRPPVVTTYARLNGERPVIGRQLVGRNAVWAGYPTPSFDYQWYKCGLSGAVASTGPAGCDLISGATQLGYTPVNGDFGRFLRLRITAQNEAGTSQYWTDTSDAVRGSIPSLTLPPVFSAQPVVNKSLAVSTGTWQAYPGPITFFGGWYRCNAPGAVADSLPGGCSLVSTGLSSYTPTTADIGSYLRVMVSATNQGISKQIWSATSAIVSGVGPSLKTAPSILGIAKAGGTLTASAGVWNGVPAPRIAYQWYVCNSAVTSIKQSVPAGCVSISGASGSKLRLTSAQKGKYVALVVTVSNQFGTRLIFTRTTTRVP